MPRDPFKKLTPGEPLDGIPARAWNAMLEAAVAHKDGLRAAGGVPAAFSLSGYPTVLVRNESGDTVERFGVLEIGAPLIEPGESPDGNTAEFQSRITFAGTAPTDASATICITLEPLGEDAIGRAVVMGAVPARIVVTDEGHEYAQPAEGETEYLESGTDGPVKILWVQSEEDAEGDPEVESVSSFPSSASGWTGSSGATAAGGSEASWALSGDTSDPLVLSGFSGLSAIPADAEIVGIKLVVHRRKDGDAVTDDSVVLTKDGTPAGNDGASPSGWPNELEAAIYGGADNLWGAAWTVAEVQSLGVEVSAESAGSATAYIDYVQVTVYYTRVVRWAYVLLGGGTPSPPPSPPLAHLKVTSLTDDANGDYPAVLSTPVPGVAGSEPEAWEDGEEGVKFRPANGEAVELDKRYHGRYAGVNDDDEAVYVSDRLAGLTILTIKEADGDPSFSGIHTVEFAGEDGIEAVVTDPSAGVARVTVSPSGDNRFWELEVNEQTPTDVINFAVGPFAVDLSGSTAALDIEDASPTERGLVSLGGQNWVGGKTLLDTDWGVTGDGVYGIVRGGHYYPDTAPSDPILYCGALRWGVGGLQSTSFWDLAGYGGTAKILMTTVPFLGGDERTTIRFSGSTTVGGGDPPIPGVRVQVQGEDGNYYDINATGTMATQDADDVEITGGVIDGTVIGGTTPAALTATTIEATGDVDFSAGTTTIGDAVITGGTIDDTVIGSTTPAAGTFTALTATGATVLADVTTEDINAEDITCDSITVGPNTLYLLDADESNTLALKTAALSTNRILTFDLAGDYSIVLGSTLTVPTTPAGDRLFYWDFAGGAHAYLELGAGLSIVDGVLGSDFDTDGFVATTGTVADNQVARYDGDTGELIQGSGVTIDDTGNVHLTSHGSSIVLYEDGSPSETTVTVQVLAPGVDPTNGTLQIGLANGTRILNMAANLTVSGTATISGTHTGSSSGTNTGDQTLPTRDSLGLDTDDSPQFAGINFGHASDTTVTRVSAGVIAVEGVTILTTATGQPLNANLTAIAGLTSAADKLIRFTGSGTADLVTLDADDTLAANSDDRIPTQQAVKAFVENSTGGASSWKTRVRAATTSAKVLSFEFENGSSIDGVTLATGDRVLIKNQANDKENGIYTVNASGAPTRATDADTGAEIAGCVAVVSEGTVNAETLWTCTNNTATLGSSSIVFLQVGGPGLYTSDPTQITISSDRVISIYTGYVGQTSITTLGTVTTGSWHATVVAGQYGGTGVNNSGKTITLGGNLTTSGANNVTLTTSGATNVTLPTTGTLATLAGAETLTGKTINLANNTITCTLAELNTAVSDANVASLAGSETLTNKTLTSPVLTTPQINDTSADHQYIVAVSELTSDRTVTLPLLTGDDTFVFAAFTQTLTNKTLTSPVLTTPQINDTSADHQYIIAVSELTSDRTVTLPLLTGDDTFVFAAFTQTLTNKTLTTPLLTRLVEANTAGSGSPNALTSAESYTHLTNEGATAENYHTLPTAAAGLVFSFTCQDANGIRITAASGDTIRYAQTVSATAGYIRSSVIGSTVTLEAINATEWIATAWTGHWTIDATTADTTSYGYATLGSAYNFPGGTANSTYVQPGLSVVLPGAGKWRLKYALNGLINFSAGGNGRLFARLYNVTASAEVANTLNEVVFWPTTGASATDMRYCETVATVTVATTIRVEVYSHGGTTWVARAIDYPGTFLAFERVP